MPRPVSFAATIQSLDDWRRQAGSLNPDVAAEAQQALSTGLLTAKVTTTDGQTVSVLCDASEVVEGTLHLTNRGGMVVAAFASGQWQHLTIEQPSIADLHGHRL